MLSYVKSGAHVSFAAGPAQNILLYLVCLFECLRAPIDTTCEGLEYIIGMNMYHFDAIFM